MHTCTIFEVERGCSDVQGEAKGTSVQRLCTSILTGAEKLRSREGTGRADTPSKTNCFSAASTRSTVDVPRSCPPCRAMKDVRSVVVRGAVDMQLYDRP